MPNTDSGRWLSFVLRFRSGSNRQQVLASPEIDVQQTASEATRKSIMQKFPTMAPSDFSLKKKIYLHNISSRGIVLGSIYYCNKTSNEVVIKASVTTCSDGSLCDAKKRRCVLEVPPEQAGPRSLSKAWNAMLESGKFSDVTLCVEGEELPAHKAVLAARSAVFETMFETECLETRSGKVHFEDISLDVFKQLLRYIYTGELENLRGAAGPPGEVRDGHGEDSDDSDYPGADGVEAAGDRVMELLIAADKYMVADLRALCQQRMAARLSRSGTARALGLCDVLRAAHLLDSTPLREVGVAYLREHRDDVLASPEWKEFTKLNRKVAAEALLDSM